MAAGLRARRGQRSRAAGGTQRPDRAAGRALQRLGVAGWRACGERAAAADARFAAARRDGRGRPRSATATAGHPGRAQGPRGHPGPPVHRRQPHPQGLHRALRRAHRGAPRRGRRGHPRQDQHGRVRHGLVDRALRLGPDRPTPGTWPRARWLVGWLGRGRGGLPRAAGHRHRHRRLHPPARGPHRHGRPAAHLRPRQPLRHHRLRLHPGPDRPVRARRARRGACCSAHRRPRPARLHLGAGAGAGLRRAAPRLRRRGRRRPARHAPRPAAAVLRDRHGARRGGARP